MLRRGLRSLNNLEATEAVETQATINNSPFFIVPKSIDALSDPALAAALIDFNSSNSY